MDCFSWTDLLLYGVLLLLTLISEVRRILCKCSYVRLSSRMGLCNSLLYRRLSLLLCCLRCCLRSLSRSYDLSLLSGRLLVSSLDLSLLSGRLLMSSLDLGLLSGRFLISSLDISSPLLLFAGWSGRL